MGPNCAELDLLPTDPTVPRQLSFRAGHHFFFDFFGRCFCELKERVEASSSPSKEEKKKVQSVCMHRLETPRARARSVPRNNAYTTSMIRLSKVHAQRAYPSADGSSSWGGNAVELDGAWHLYVSPVALACGMECWNSQQYIRHAVSTGGPVRGKLTPLSPPSPTHGCPRAYTP